MGSCRRFKGGNKRDSRQLLFKCTNDKNGWYKIILCKWKCLSSCLTAAATSSNCTDIWNSTGVQFDTSCRAYTDAYSATGSTELIDQRYYALCAGGPIAKYQRTAPYWTDLKNSCSE